jgi:hypothetical protein
MLSNQLFVVAFDHCTPIAKATVVPCGQTNFLSLLLTIALLLLKQQSFHAVKPTFQKVTPS